MRKKKTFFASLIDTQEKRDREALKRYCKEQGYPQDYENIVLPLLNAYGWELLYKIGALEMEEVGLCGLLITISKVTYLNLDRLSTLVEWNEGKRKFVAVN